MSEQKAFLEKVHIKNYIGSAVFDSGLLQDLMEDPLC